MLFYPSTERRLRLALDLPSSRPGCLRKSSHTHPSSARGSCPRPGIAPNRQGAKMSAGPLGTPRGRLFCNQPRRGTTPCRDPVWTPTFQTAPLASASCEKPRAYAARGTTPVDGMACTVPTPPAASFLRDTLCIRTGGCPAHCSLPRAEASCGPDDTSCQATPNSLRTCRADAP